MKIFKCSNCGQLLYFENTACENCQFQQGFHVESMQLIPMAPQFRYCANYGYGVCNWLVPANSVAQFCRACELNRTIPDLSKPEYQERWRKIEIAKHRLIYSLLRLKLPVESKLTNDKGLWFDFVANITTGQKTKVILTGHERGLITLNIAEADDIEREMTRKKMHEVYRTVLGHFRHEVGHYYWDRLVAGSDKLAAFREIFGDEQADYGQALEKNYNEGPRADWSQFFISTYASIHPWEDWAETWAHYLHIIDTLETAHAYGLSIDPVVADASTAVSVDIDADPYSVQDFNKIMKQWMPLTIAMNSLNRSMGLPDPYPFVINTAVTKKLAFIHDICYSFRKMQKPAPAQRVN